MTVKVVLCGLVGLMAATALSAAGTRFDSRIDEAAREIVAARMGDLRGSFAPGEKTVFIWQEMEQQRREPLKVLQYGRYRESSRSEHQKGKAR